VGDAKLSQDRPYQDRPADPPTERINVTEARRGWSGLLNRVFRREARIVIEKSGIPVAAIISYRDYEAYRRLRARLEERFKALNGLAEPFKDVSPEEIEREVAKAIAEVRAESRERSAAHDERPNSASALPDAMRSASSRGN